MRPIGSVLVLCALVAVLALAPPAAGAPNPPAFPGAHGFGAGATGGRGGRVVIVSTLEPFGPGSLGAALDPVGAGLPCEPRYVVFDVGGVIEVSRGPNGEPHPKYDYDLTCGNVTIAGQTAPGPGITIHGRINAYEANPGGNMIIRHLRIRAVPLSNEFAQTDYPFLSNVWDALTLSHDPASGSNNRLMLDHLSLSWSSDENLDLFEGVSDATVQWSTIEESSVVGDPEGPHNYGMIAGPDFPRISIHHVLFANQFHRAPALAAGPAELRSSVIYNVQVGFMHDNPAAGEFQVFDNTFRQGPSDDDLIPFMLNDEDGPATPTQIWLDNNRISATAIDGIVGDIRGTPLATEDYAFVVCCGTPDSLVTAGSDFAAVSNDYAPLARESPDEAYGKVLEFAGAFPRDVVTVRTVDEVRNRTGGWGVREPGLIGQPASSEALLAGLPAPETRPADFDTDHDGMADEWERANGLNVGVDDHGERMADGYDAIEHYINELSAALVGAPAQPSPGPGATGGGIPGPTTAQTTTPGGPAPGSPIPTPAGGGPRADVATTQLLAAFAALMSTLAAVLSAIALFVLRQRTRPDALPPPPPPPPP